MATRFRSYLNNIITKMRIKNTFSNKEISLFAMVSIKRMILFDRYN